MLDANVVKSLDFGVHDPSIFMRIAHKDIWLIARIGGKRFFQRNPPNRRVSLCDLTHQIIRGEWQLLAESGRSELGRERPLTTQSGLMHRTKLHPLCARISHAGCPYCRYHPP